jgi:hypothetical protein
MREPPMISVEVISSALAQATTGIQANAKTNRQRAMRRDDGEGNPVQGME